VVLKWVSSVQTVPPYYVMPISSSIKGSQCVDGVADSAPGKYRSPCRRMHLSLEGLKLCVDDVAGSLLSLMHDAAHLNGNEARNLLRIALDRR
jgi:hypothetical protein